MIQQAELYPLKVGTEFRIMPEHSMQDYAYILLDPMKGGRVDPFRVITYDRQKEAFIALADYHHLLKFRELSDAWTEDQIFHCMNNSVEQGALAADDAKTALEWYYQGIKRPQRTFSRSESILITAGTRPR